MFIEQNNSPGKIINLDHVSSMDWDKGLTTEFIMANGQIITWTYDKEEDQREDHNMVSKHLHNADKLLSVELDQE